MAHDLCAKGDAAALEQAQMLVASLNWFWHIGGQHLTGRAIVDALLTMSARQGAQCGSPRCAAHERHDRHRHERLGAFAR